MSMKTGIKKFGWRGAGNALLEGAGWAGGFQGTKEGMRFLGGMPLGQAGGKLLTGGIGAIGVGLATGSVGAGMLTGFIAGGPLVMPLLTAYDMYNGYKQGGVGGALKAGLTDVAIGAGFNLALKAGGAALGSSVAITVGGSLAIIGGLGYGSLKVMQALAEKGRSIERTNFLADTTAYYTNAALTTRQRAIQEIARAGVNANMYLGQEASFMHDVPRARIGNW